MRRRRRQGLAGHLRDARDVLLLIAPGAEPGVLLESIPGATSQALSSPVPRPRERDAVVLVVRDRAHLRSAITGVANFGSARQVCVWFERPVRRLPIATPHPEWPAVDQVVANRSPEGFVVVSFLEPAQVRPVLVEFAKAAAPSGRLAVGWPAVGAEREHPACWPPADPSAKVALLPRLLDQSVELPPDVVLVAGTEPEPPPSDDHPTLGRPTRVEVVEPDLTWAAWRSLTGGEASEALARRGRESLGPVDDQVINPIGFERDPAGPAASLRGARDGSLVVASDRSVGSGAVDVERGLGDADLPALRDLVAVHLDWVGGRGPQHYCRVVAELAAAGVPLVTDTVPDWARHLLSPELLAVLAAPVDLTDRLRREEHSVRIRRAALRDHGQRAWRRALARRHGLQEVAQPRISALLVTRRPGMFPVALRQLARQRWGSLEVVLATHGFEPDAGVLAAFQEKTSIPMTTLTVDSSVPFGRVLNAAAERASGELLAKLDDDDWYAPDFLGDLELAHGYSGAELVGCPPEFTFIEPLWLTTRRATPTEVYKPFVAGGTLLVERGFFWSLGGFRHTLRSVDATLLSAVTGAGGRVFRTHGLGYVLRRAASGHTWDPGLGYFLTSERATDQWRGFRPSAILDPDPTTLPERPSGGADTLDMP